MKILQSLSLLLLLVLLAMAWATWDMQRHEAAAPGMDPAALQLKAAPATVTHAPAPAMAACPTCRGLREVHLAKEGACKACGGNGIIQGSLSTHATTICNACRGTGKITKDTVQDCPTCKRAGQLAPALAAQFKTCPKCQGVKTIEAVSQVNCQSCRGTGKVISEMSKLSPGSCPFCSGTGKLDRKEKNACPDCFGSGVTPPPPPAPTT